MRRPGPGSEASPHDPNTEDQMPPSTEDQLSARASDERKNLNLDAPQRLLVFSAVGWAKARAQALGMAQPIVRRAHASGTRANHARARKHGVREAFTTRTAVPSPIARRRRGVRRPYGPPYHRTVGARL